jgi:hypothetical protein
MSLTMDNLQYTFEGARKNNAIYVAVKIETRGHPETEVIINPYENFDVKLEEYKREYNYDLTSKDSKDTRIVGLTWGDCFDELECDFESDGENFCKE